MPNLKRFLLLASVVFLFLCLSTGCQHSSDDPVYGAVEPSLILRRPLEWHVHSLALGYDIQEEGTVTERHVDIIEALSDSKVLEKKTDDTEGTTKLGGEVHAGVDGKLSFPFTWAANIKGGASLSFNRQSVSRQTSLLSRSRQQVFSDKASQIYEMLSKKGIKNLHLSFTVTLTNNSDEEMIFMPGNAFIPVYMGNKSCGKYAKPYDLAAPSAPISVAASPGTDILFRLELDTTTARKLVAFMGRNAPTIDLRRGNFPVRTGKIRDVVAASSTVPLRLSLAGISGEWNIREKHTSNGRPVTLREALQAVEQELSKQKLNIFGWKGKRLDTISSIPFEGFSQKDRDLRYIALVEMGERVGPVFDQALLDQPLPQEGCILWIVDLSQAKKYADESPAFRKAVFSRVTKVASPSPAQKFRIGELYDEGVFAEKDDQKAVEWYKKAAEEGDALAQNSLGVFYDKGRVVRQDHVEAAKWFRKSAKQGYAQAQCNLGECYYSGQGVAQDYAEAVKWYRKSADRGNTDAQNMLGVCYCDGQGVSQDYAEAVKWFRKSAAQGNSWAQYNLGNCYNNGPGVWKDRNEAIRWYRMAAAQGLSEAKKALDNLGVSY